MNWDIVKGNAEQAKGKMKEMWAELTDNEVLEMQASADQMSWKLQEKYWMSKLEAEKAIDEFVLSLQK